MKAHNRLGKRQASWGSALLLLGACSWMTVACSDDTSDPDGGAGNSGVDGSGGDSTGSGGKSGSGGESTSSGGKSGSGGSTGSGGNTGTEPQKRVVFFLGDGMGIPVITASRIYQLGEEGSLTMDTLPETAFIRTYSNDSQVTDSAPSMAAYVTGVKGNNGVISMTPDASFGGTDGKPVTTFAEIAEGAGWATGVVSTARVTHATPAACYAHTNNRDDENGIAIQLVPGGSSYNTALGDGLEVVLGGGRRHFLPNTTGGSRTDGRDLVAEFKGKGYAYVSNKAEFDAIDDKTEKLVGLFTNSHMAYELDRKPDSEPSLADMTEKAIQILSKNETGFFLMVEGGRIDHALHETNAKRALVDTIAFDDAIARALDVLRETDPKLENTLVFFTADHDHTMILNGYAKRTGPTTSGNAGILGLVRNYSGSNEGQPSLDADGRPYTILGFGNGENRVNGARSSVAALTEDVTSADNYHQEAAILMPTGSETHGGTDVVLHAIGRGADGFHGIMDNTEVFSVLRAASGL